MGDQGSTYAVLQSVPVMVSPLYILPKKVSANTELQALPNDLSHLPTYSFHFERDVLSQIEIARKRTHEAEEALEIKKKQYEEERINKQKLAARKIAPGFLDTDTRILQPQQTYVYDQPTTHSPDSEESRPIVSPKMPYPSLNGITSSPTPPHTHITSSASISLPTAATNDMKHFDYLKFEQGLAPADPWDTPENDMLALKSILGSPKSNYVSPKSHSSPPAYLNQPQQPQQSQQAYAQPLTSMSRPYQKNEGVYWNIQSNHSSPAVGNYPTQQRHSTPVPALPPKLFSNSPLPSSSTSSPVISSPPAPHTLLPSEYHKSNTNIVSSSSSSTSVLPPPPPPPLPPPPLSQPTIPHENLIAELGNMGFTRAQSIDALEKNDYDLMKATNFLLDQA
ncbi:hypothetical protein A0J61_01421 [Choanephora cucurbitarum]|uniref:UBA domain-containing protein n=1 Tax=Choanephora cucurbitarum TaxID=101091 RepID=A0A1C7NN05_9FUNG|nr:hypothetical protein A0J61_01421 [Choanephora cucurbitarum]